MPDRVVCLASAAFLAFCAVSGKRMQETTNKGPAVRTRFKTMIVTGALAVGLLAPVAAADASAAPKTKACSASVSVTNPKQNTVVTVRVAKISAAASITTVAHYKSKNTTNTGRANAKGLGSTTYKIGPATKKYKVVVDVTAVKGAQKWTCRTAFTPR